MSFYKITMNKVSYGLKVNTDFTESEIKKNTRVININKKEHVQIHEEKFKNDFLSHYVINLNAEGASVEFIGRYKANNSLVDVSCEVNHNADNTKSLINIRGIAEAKGKIISRTNIYVKEGVRGVEGEEKCKYIFVSPSLGGVGEVGGEIDALPALDINSHEVRVSHAVSIYKIKKSDIWYAGLHSFSQKEAEKIFKESFLN